jgi:hypothetical protein
VSWRRIKSAPKDGTWVLLCGGRTSEEPMGGDGVWLTRPVVARWVDLGYMQGWAFCHWDSAWREFYEDPTYWKPLPVLVGAA